MDEFMIALKLQLFADGAGDGTGDGNQAAAGDEGTQDQQPEAAEDLDAEFEELISGKYKDAYGKKVGKTVQQRVRGLKGTADRYNAMAPALEVLAARYDLAIDDPKLIEAIAGDKSLLEAKALRNDRSTDDEFAMARANAAEARANALIANILAQQDAQKWAAEAEIVKQKYPGFDLDTELQDPRFQELLSSKYGFGVETAYLALHGSDVMQQVATKTKKEAAATVAAGKARPRENGAGAGAAATVGINPANMSHDQYMEIKRRVERGERISFG